MVFVWPSRVGQVWVMSAGACVCVCDNGLPKVPSYFQAEIFDVHQGETLDALLFSRYTPVEPLE